MATYQQGILGDFSGKVGPVIGARWRGKAVLRSIPSKSQKPPSPAQQLQRDKFKYIHNFLAPIKPLLANTFGTATGSRSCYNQAISYHLKEAVRHHGNAFEMLYTKVLISMGPLCGLEQPVVTHPENGRLFMAWTDNSNQSMAYATDALLVVAYAPAIKQFACFTASAYREDASCVLDFEPVFHGLEVQLWAGFTHSQTQQSATSRYLGCYMV
ncbi:DUF6266 family protein [Aestuariibaculum suncheonense]|uniref:Uncharacterized protein n=1 Tax=Aestuariibaculum suncheonense TaxID=1028745 RepID=A0A8J6UAM7_9FLAO|nr:DUF6266 family protein [Aestuariibaculum suncheonense]MBD0835468.1 hypothetical protein [Aestuariibaculum suncheonense]